MTTPKHTPSPWVYHRGDPLPSGHGREFPHVHIGDIDEWDSLTVNSGATTLDQCDANAVLIATAPDLLEALDNTTAALETLLAHYGNQMPYSDLEQRQKIANEARQLVIKVRGE